MWTGFIVVLPQWLPHLSSVTLEHVNQQGFEISPRPLPPPPPPPPLSPLVLQQACKILWASTGILRCSVKDAEQLLDQLLKCLVWSHRRSGVCEYPWLHLRGRQEEGHDPLRWRERLQHRGQSVKAGLPDWQLPSGFLDSLTEAHDMARCQSFQ